MSWLEEGRKKKHNKDTKTNYNLLINEKYGPRKGVIQ